MKTNLFAAVAALSLAACGVESPAAESDNDLGESAGQLGTGDVVIDCALTPAQSAQVEAVSLFSATDEIKLQYRNGSTETVKVAQLQNAGLFGTESFSADLVSTKGRAFAPNTAAGPIYVQFGCYTTPTIPIERCTSQGDGSTAKYAGVRMNLHGKPLAFFGNNVCRRTDRTP